MCSLFSHLKKNLYTCSLFSYRKCFRPGARTLFPRSHVTHAPILQEIKKRSRGPHVRNEPRAPSPLPSPPATATAGSPSFGHLCPNRAPICDPRCSTFPFPPVSPPPVVCARRSGTRRRRRSSWSGRSSASLPP
jgi:hypothetical protein